MRENGTTMRIKNSEEFGATVRAFRKARGITQQQLADICGCSIMFISNLERGKQTAELGLALHVLSTLSVNLEAYDRRGAL